MRVYLLRCIQLFLLSTSNTNSLLSDVHENQALALTLCSNKTINFNYKINQTSCLYLIAEFIINSYNCDSRLLKLLMNCGLTCKYKLLFLQLKPH